MVIWWHDDDVMIMIQWWYPADDHKRLLIWQWCGGDMTAGGEEWSGWNTAHCTLHTARNTTYIALWPLQITIHPTLKTLRRRGWFTSLSSENAVCCAVHTWLQAKVATYYTLGTARTLCWTLCTLDFRLKWHTQSHKGSSQCSETGSRTPARMMMMMLTSLMGDWTKNTSFSWKFWECMLCTLDSGH